MRKIIPRPSVIREYEGTDRVDVSITPLVSNLVDTMCRWQTKYQPPWEVPILIQVEQGSFLERLLSRNKGLGIGLYTQQKGDKSEIASLVLRYAEGDRVLSRGKTFDLRRRQFGFEIEARTGLEEALTSGRTIYYSLTFPSLTSGIRQVREISPEHLKSLAEKGY